MRLSIFLLALSASAVNVFAQSSAQQSGKPAAPVSAVLADRAIAQAFENGLITPTVTGQMLQTLTLSWHAYPTGHYRLQRSAHVNGPWVTIHDVSTTNDVVPGLPPNAQFFVRVLALKDGGKPGYLVADSTLPVAAVTGPPVYTGLGPQNIVTCSPAGGHTVNLSWSGIPGFTRYLFTAYVGAKPAAGTADAPNTMPNTLAATPFDTIKVDGTKLTYTLPVGGLMTLRIQGRVDYSDWPGPGQTYSFVTRMPTPAGGLPGTAIVSLDANGVTCY